MEREQVKAEIGFIHREWYLVLWWVVLKGIVYGAQAAIVALFVKWAWSK